MADTSTATTSTASVTTTKQASALSWFEIRPLDIARARAFYE